MIIRKASARSRLLRFGCSGDSVDVPPEALGALLYFLPPSLERPLAALPVKRQQLARVAMIASPRVHDGFAWHNACYELTSSNWQAVLRLARPDYLLVESCLYDSARAWNLHAFDSAAYAAQLHTLAEAARMAGVPSVFWYTLGEDMLDFFLEGMRTFDFVGCADTLALERLTRSGIAAHPLPWAFAPEQFNPLTNFKLAEYPPTLLFDGIARMMRFPLVRETLDALRDMNLHIIDTGMLTTPYNLERFPHRALAAHVRGDVSQTIVQELYKTVGAYLSVEDAPGCLPPAQHWRALEAAACRCPVLHCGNAGHNETFLKDFVEILPSPEAIKTRYTELLAQSLERERAGHLAWRAAHNRHTFAHRMDAIHSWLGISRTAVPKPLASIVTPSMRPQNQAHVLRQYEQQSYPCKELVYVFNGDAGQIPSLPTDRQDIRIVHVPREYSTGMVMNAGLQEAKGEYVFKLDDDDLYGNHYVADRMIYFREFSIVVLGTTRSFFTFKEEEKAFSLNRHKPRQDCISGALGNVEYSLSHFTGATVAMSRSYALALGYQEQAYANADVSFLYKSIFFVPTGAYANMDRLNFCVQRGNPQEHTWAAGKAELLEMRQGDFIDRKHIFL